MHTIIRTSMHPPINTTIHSPLHPWPQVDPAHEYYVGMWNVISPTTHTAPPPFTSPFTPIHTSILVRSAAIPPFQFLFLFLLIFF